MADEVLEKVKKGLEGIAKSIENPRHHRIIATVPREEIVNAASTLNKTFGTQYSVVITARDAEDDIELTYPIALEKEERLIILKTRVPKSDPNIDTITEIMPGANLYEREAFEMLGVNFRGHPRMEILFLPENWGDKGNPLRKDWDGPVQGGEE